MSQNLRIRLIHVSFITATMVTSPSTWQLVLRSVVHWIIENDRQASAVTFVTLKSQRSVMIIMTVILHVAMDMKGMWTVTVICANVHDCPRQVQRHQQQQQQQRQKNRSEQSMTTKKFSSSFSRPKVTWSTI
jgi:hypothetical protein